MQVVLTLAPLHCTHAPHWACTHLIAPAKARAVYSPSDRPQVTSMASIAACIVVIPGGRCLLRGHQLHCSQPKWRLLGKAAHLQCSTIARGQCAGPQASTSVHGCARGQRAQASTSVHGCARGQRAQASTSVHGCCQGSTCTSKHKCAWMLPGVNVQAHKQAQVCMWMCVSGTMQVLYRPGVSIGHEGSRVGLLDTV